MYLESGSTNSITNNASALSMMIFCVGFPTTLTPTIQRTNLISITVNTTGRLRFTDHIAVNRDVQIPANVFYTPVGLVKAIIITALTSNVILKYMFHKFKFECCTKLVISC